MRIVVIDDERAIRRFLRTAFSTHGRAIFEAAEYVNTPTTFERGGGLREGGNVNLLRANLLRLNISKLRRKVEPDPARPRYILTEPGVGYRLNVAY